MRARRDRRRTETTERGDKASDPEGEEDEFVDL